MCRLDVRHRTELAIRPIKPAGCKDTFVLEDAVGARGQRMRSTPRRTDCLCSTGGEGVRRRARNRAKDEQIRRDSTGIDPYLRVIGERGDANKETRSAVSLVGHILEGVCVNYSGSHIIVLHADTRSSGCPA